MNALSWVMTPDGSNPPNEYYCPTRDVGQARVEKILPELIQGGWNDGAAALLTAVMGELVGNCFDHNLGQWIDTPGCWLETSLNDPAVRMIVADRGQGIRATLQQVLPDLQDDKQALLVAFTKTITGRAPEQRGNGLKFVLRSLNQMKVKKFKYLSGTAKFMFMGTVDTKDISGYILEAPMLRGTYTEITVQKAV